MKAKVKLSYSVELFVEADNEEQLRDWMSQITPSEAQDDARKNGKMIDESYSEEIICNVREDSDVDISIKTK